MLNGSDKETFHSLRLLRDVVGKREKPLVIWTGAGVSMWCGFPGWRETAEQFHASYRKFEPKYDAVQGLLLLQAEKYPELFEIFRRIDARRYNRELVSLFGVRTPTPVYRRFLGIIGSIRPLQIVTTNVDETLERNIANAETIQRSDLERCLDLVTAGESFVAKMHGSVGSVETCVFATTDYEQLVGNEDQIKILQMLFARATVLFVGYSFRDKYILELFEANCGLRRLFGDGPHFLVQAGDSATFPDSIKPILYIPEPYSDHRSAMMVLDIARVARDADRASFIPQDQASLSDEANKRVSGYFISDVTPPGTWTSSHTLQLAKGDLRPMAIVGQGFDNTELPTKTSPAMHDLTVGLISFDSLHAPLSCAAKLHDLLGAETFWELITTKVIRLIYFEKEPVMMFRSLDAVDGGDIGVFGISVEGGRPLTVDEQIRRQIRALPGREAEADRLFETLTQNTFTFDDRRFNIPNLTRGALLHPSVRRLLGISDAVLPNSLPHWSRFPVIRLAHTIMAGCTCENFSLPATKIAFGSEILVGAAFAVSAARDWADSVSSYVLSGQFNADLGAYVTANPQVLKALMKFRDSEVGARLRREILDELATNAGSEFVASVDAGLRRIIPTAVMDSSRDMLSGLLLRNSRNRSVVPAVWTNLRNSDSIARTWRARSKREFDEYCRLRGLKERHLCPCGSGEKLKFCCAEALSDV